MIYELLGCPFCGGTNIDPKEWSQNDGKSGPGCGDCGALAESVEAWNRRAAPATAQLDADLPPLPAPKYPHIKMLAHTDKSERAGYTAEQVEKIRRSAVAQYAERIRLLERDAIGLRHLLAWRVAGALLYTDDGELQDNTARPSIDFKRDPADAITSKLAERAYIDGRTASTAPTDELRKTVNAHCNDLLDCAAILHDDGRFKETAAEIRVAVAELKSALAAAPSPLSGTEEAQ